MKAAHGAGGICPVTSNLGAGGSERVALTLMQQQLQMGDEVLLLCARGSELTGAEVVELVNPRFNKNEVEYQAISIIMARKICQHLRQRDDVDIVHDQTGGFIPLFADTLSQPVVVTLHNGIGQNELFVRDCIENVTYVAISQNQLQMLQQAGFDVRHFVHHDVDTQYLLNVSLQPSRKKLVFIGRMDPKKGPDLAVQVALRSGYELLLAGGVEEQHQQWFEDTVLRYVDGERICYLGTIQDQDKPSFFEGASAFIMPNRCYENALCLPWYEPFGLVIMEALAAGLPVFGTLGGSLPELVANCGFLASGTNDEAIIEQMLNELPFADMISPELCRSRAREFLPGAAARKYREIYHALLA
jgi:glycosyltransferase involved in cell wall biosynthesis